MHVPLFFMHQKNDKKEKKERGEVTWCRGEELLIWEVYVRLVVLMKDVEAGVSC